MDISSLPCGVRPPLALGQRGEERKKKISEFNLSMMHIVERVGGSKPIKPADTPSEGLQASTLKCYVQNHRSLSKMDTGEGRGGRKGGRGNMKHLSTVLLLKKKIKENYTVSTV